MQKILDDIQVNSDQVVIDKIVNGDSALFEILIRRTNPVLYKIARSYGFNHQDAEDLMQDTHVAAFTGLKSFENRASYKTWISRIMVNKCIYKLKYGYFKNEVYKGPGLESNPLSMQEEKPDNQTENFLLNRELTVLLEKSLQRIPAIYRTVFILREVEGFSIAETAEMLDITPMNVKVRLNRAKTLLQNQIQQFYSRADLYSFNLIYCDTIVHRVFERINKML